MFNSSPWCEDSAVRLKSSQLSWVNRQKQVVCFRLIRCWCVRKRETRCLCWWAELANKQSCLSELSSGLLCQQLASTLLYLFALFVKKNNMCFWGGGGGGLDRQKTESQMVDVQICETWQVFKCAASQGVELCWHYSPFSREGINHFTWVKDLQVSPTQDNQFHLVVKQQQNQFDMPHWLQLQHTAHLNMLGVSCVTDLYSI